MDERTSQALSDLLEFAAMGERIVARGSDRYDQDARAIAELLASER